MIIFFVIALALPACTNKTNRVNDQDIFSSTGRVDNSGGNDNSGSDGLGGVPGSCNATGVSDINNPNAEDYHIFQVIGPGRLNSYLPVWSSQATFETTDPVTGMTSTSFYIEDQSIFLTDFRLRFRFVARPAPPVGSPSQQPISNQWYNNSNCVFPDQYLRLKFKVGVKSANSTSSTYDQVVSVNSLHIDEGEYSVCSDIYDINMNTLPPSNEPFKVDIYDVHWDRCGTGVVSMPPQENPACPFSPVDGLSCVHIEMQMVTDNTYNFN